MSAKVIRLWRIKTFITGGQATSATLITGGQASFAEASDAKAASAT